MTDVTASVTRVGNPAGDFASGWTYARNVWDLQAFGGKLYIGCGNSANSGTDTNVGSASGVGVPILTYEPGVGFDDEGTIAQEQVNRFRVLDFGSGDTLAIPGQDPTGSNIPHWYRLESGSWVQHTDSGHTVVHSLDIYALSGAIYLGTDIALNSVVLRSTDDGSSWSASTNTNSANTTYFFEFGGKLYASTTFPSGFNTPGLLEYQSGDTWTGVSGSNPRFGDMFTGITQGSDVGKIVRSATFDSKWVYIGGRLVNDHQWEPYGLWSLTAISTSGVTGVTAISLPNGALPYDLLVDGSTLYVLGYHVDGSSNGVVGVYSATDLSSWAEEFSFIPADVGGVDSYDHTFARSFEKLDGVWYFGLGSNTGTQPDNVGDILAYDTDPGVGGGMTTTTVAADVNQYIQDAQPSVVANGDDGFWATGEFGGSQVNRGLLHFPTASLPDDADDWTSVTLRLTVQGNFLGTGHTLNVYRVRRTWFDGTTPQGSWDNYRQDLTQAWSTAGAGNTSNDREGTPVGSASVTSGTTTTLDITLDAASIKEWKSGGFANNGLILVASDESASSSTLMRWLPKNDGTAGNRPSLIIEHEAGGVGGSLTSVAIHDGLALVAGGSAHRVDFVGTDTTWNSVAPTITVDHGSLGAITVDSDTTAHADYTPPVSAQTVTFTDETDGDTTDTLTVVAAATGYAITPASASGQTGVASSSFTVALVPSGSASENAITITPAISPDGSVSGTVALSARTVDASGTFTVTPAADGAHTISISDGAAGLDDSDTSTYTSAAEVTATLRAQVAGWMDSDSPTSVLDGGTATGFFATGHFSTPQTNRGLLYFDLSGIPPDAIITAATLKLHVGTNFLGDAHDLEVYRLRERWFNDADVIGSWARSQQSNAVDWTTAGAEDGTDDRDPTPIGSVGLTSSTTGQVSIDLDADVVQELVDGTFALRGGFLLQASDEAGQTLIRWDGHEVTTAANRPTLELVYTAPAHAITDGLVAYYKFDDAAPNDDSSGNAHALTPQNGPIASAVGTVGQARHFDPSLDQFMLALDNLGIDWAESWTVTLWYKMAANDEFWTPVSCSNQYGSSGTHGGFKLFYHDIDTGLDYFVAQLYDDSDGIVPGDSCIADTVALAYGNPPLNTWAFIAIRHDHLRKFFQVIGPTSKDSAGHHATGQYAGRDVPYTGTPSNTSNPFLVGAIRSSDAPDYLEHWNGDLDNLTVHDRWLSDEEIQGTLYNDGDGLEIGGGGGGGTRRRRGRFALSLLGRLRL